MYVFMLEAYMDSIHSGGKAPKQKQKKEFEKGT
jgi:hypothetical protein